MGVRVSPKGLNIERCQSLAYWASLLRKWSAVMSPEGSNPSRSAILQKYGWVEKVIVKTGYTKRIIENTIKHFIKDFEGKYFRRKFEK